MRIEVIHAHAGGIWRCTVDLPEGATLARALEVSGFRQAFPELPADIPTGVYGRLAPHQCVLQPGDRVEVYRPLAFDPMESRRRRLQHRQRTSGAG